MHDGIRIAIQRVRCRVRIDTDEIPYGDGEPCFFIHFTLNGFLQGFARFPRTTWHHPEAIITALLPKDMLTIWVPYHCSDTVLRLVRPAGHRLSPCIPERGQAFPP